MSCLIKFWNVFLIDFEIGMFCKYCLKYFMDLFFKGFFMNYIYYLRRELNVMIIDIKFLYIM